MSSDNLFNANLTEILAREKIPYFKESAGALQRILQDSQHGKLGKINRTVIISEWYIKTLEDDSSYTISFSDNGIFFPDGNRVLKCIVSKDPTKSGTTDTFFTNKYGTGFYKEEVLDDIITSTKSHVEYLYGSPQLEEKSFFGTKKYTLSQEERALILRLLQQNTSFVEEGLGKFAYYERERFLEKGHVKECINFTKGAKYEYYSYPEASYGVINQKSYIVLSAKGKAAEIKCTINGQDVDFNRFIAYYPLTDLEEIREKLRVLKENEFDISIIPESLKPTGYGQK